MGRYGLNLALLMLTAALFCACPGSQEQAADSGSGQGSSASGSVAESSTPTVDNGGSLQGASPGLPQLSLALVNGESKMLSDYKGKPLVVNFWAEW